jgi:hypothetical protein
MLTWIPVLHAGMTPEQIISIYIHRIHEWQIRGHLLPAIFVATVSGSVRHNSEKEVNKKDRKSSIVLWCNSRLVPKAE